MQVILYVYCGNTRFIIAKLQLAAVWITVCAKNILTNAFQLRLVVFPQSIKLNMLHKT